MLQQIEKQLDFQVPLSVLYEFPSLVGFVGQLAAGRGDRPGSMLVPILAEGEGPILFFLNGRPDRFARYLPAGLRLYWIDHLQDSRNVSNQSVEELAAEYLEAIQSVQPQGPYNLAGFCFGGKVAYEIACMLEARGEQTDVLVMLDPFNPDGSNPETGLIGNGLNNRLRAPDLPGRIVRFAGRRLKRARTALLTLLGKPIPPKLLLDRNLQIFARASQNYRPGSYAGRTTIVTPAESAGMRARREGQWRKIAANLDVVAVEDVSDHVELVHEPAVQVVADIVTRALADAGQV
jgi:thioesterase domain-containing protein